MFGQLNTHTLALYFAMATIGWLMLALPVAAQQVQSQPNGGRDCQVVRTCNFTKGGTFRGCLSSYSCKTCRMVASRCSVGTARNTCQELRCDWGA
jgi:hypothetical protein